MPRLPFDPRKALENREFRFLLVGGFNTVWGFGVTSLFLWLLLPRYSIIWVLVISNIINVSVSYLTQKLLVFRTTGAWLHEYLRFYGVSIVPIGLSFVILPFLINVLKFNPHIANGLFTALSVGISYLGHKHVSFKTPKPPEPID